jgi:ubiquinone/menaquinone biosynthesis C-methylase UbiE
MLCEAVDLRGGQTVLDVATGTGNTAIAAARRWCEVAAIDYDGTMVVPSEYLEVVATKS